VGNYLLKRLFWLLVTLFGICVVSFCIVTLAPGDPASLKVNKSGRRGGGLTDQAVKKNKEIFNLDLPRLLNTSPRTRATAVQAALKELDAKVELDRKDAEAKLTAMVGTAGLDVMMADLALRATSAQAEAAALAAELDGLAQADAAALPARLAGLTERHPALVPPQAARADGQVPTPAERAAAWQRQRAALLAQAEAPARRLLVALGVIVPADRGGPTVDPEKTPLAEATKGWSDWWAAHQGDYSAAKGEAAAAAWLAADAAAIDTQSPAYLDLLKVGTRAAPPLMAALEDAAEDSPREARAAFALAAVCKKPWDLALSADERANYESQWDEKKASLDERKAATGAEALAPEIAERLEAELGAKEAFVKGKDAEARDLECYRWADWWWRAEEHFVDFGAGQQLGRAFTQTQFGRWMSRIFTLDFGESYKEKRPVMDMIVERLGPTITLNGISLFLCYLIAVPLGIFSAVRKDTVADRISSTALFVLYSMPTFWVASMLIWLCTGDGKLPAYFFRSLDAERLSRFDQLLDVAKHCILPIICLTYAEVAYVSRQMRTGLLEVIRQDYVRTARAKGLPERVVVMKHAVRNGLIPIVTLLGALLPVVFSGSVIIESIFSIDGIGKLAFDAILARDYPVIMAEVVIASFLTLVGYLLSDLAYAVVDPRIEFR
jgi:peptide/nickel transport system permease protein